MGKVSIGQLKAALKDLINGKADKTEVDAHKAENVTSFAAKLDKNGGTIQNYSETSSVNAAATGTVALNIANGNVFDITLAGNTTFTFNNPAASGKNCSFSVYLRQGGTARTVTFPSSVKWANDQIPDLSAINKTSILFFTTINGGTRWYGSALTNLTT